MRVSAKRNMWLTGLLLAVVLSAVGFVMFGGATAIARAEETAIQESDIRVSGYAQKMELQADTTRYGGLYAIDVDLGVSTGAAASYGIMDAGNKAVQEHILINGKTVKNINDTVDDSDYQYGVFPWNAGDTYAVPVLLFVPGGTTTLQAIIHANYLETLGGELEVTVTNGLTYVDGENTLSYSGNDVTYVFTASNWYKKGTEPTAESVQEVELSAGTLLPGNTTYVSFPVNQAINSTVGTYHITEAPTQWNHLANYILINGKSVAAINASVDDGAYDYTGANWFLSWAGSTPESTYCQPVFVSTEANELRLYFHKDFYSTFGKAIVVELLPGFGWSDSAGTVYLNTEREIMAIFTDTNGSIASVKGSHSEGIDVATEFVLTTAESDELYFDIEFSADIMTDNQYIGGVKFDYKGDIWLKYVFVDGVSLSECDDVRVEVSIDSVRFYVSNDYSLAGKTIVLKEKMPFSSGELLSKDYTVTFKTAPATDSEERSVCGWKKGDVFIEAGEIYGVCGEDDAASMVAVYAITYVLDGGVNNPDNPATYTGEDAITLKAPTKESHKFVKWVNAANEEVTEIPVGTKGEITLTAVWEEIIEYTISYELDGGVNSADNPDKYLGDEDITLSAPTKKGYEFVKWVDDDGEEIAVIAAGTKGNLTLTAVWKVIEYTISYELDGGENNADNPAKYTVEDTVTLAAPTKAGYEFVMWADDHGKQVTEISAGSIGNVTLTAVWTKIPDTAKKDKGCSSALYGGNTAIAIVAVLLAGGVILVRRKKINAK